MMTVQAVPRLAKGGGVLGTATLMWMHLIFIAVICEWMPTVRRDGRDGREAYMPSTSATPIAARGWLREKESHP